MFVSCYLHKFSKLYVSQNKEISQLQEQPSEVSIEKAVFRNFAIFTEKYQRWSLFLIELLAQTWRSAKGFPVNTPNILRKPIFKKICKLLLQFLLLTVKGLPYARNSIYLICSRSSLKFKEFSLGCLVLDSSLIRKKEELAVMVTRCHSL